MTANDHDELTEMMSLLACRETAVLAFVAAYGDRLRTVVRSHLRRLGRPDLARDGAEVDGLVWDVAVFIQRHAGSWRPGGALPWNWARRGIASLLAEAIGHARADLDVDQLDLALAPAELTGDDVELDDLAGVPIVSLLLTALDQIPCSRRDRQVHVEYRRQCGAGDPSPSSTVGAQFGLRSDHVRQIDRRVRAKLAALAATDQKFAPLADLAWVTGAIRVARRAIQVEVAA